MLGLDLFDDMQFNESSLIPLPSISGGGMPNARIGDKGSHGGVIVTGSHNTLINNIPAARVGDIYACVIHGPNPIVTGAPRCKINGRLAARIGDLTACGASIVTGSPNTRTGNL